MCGGPSQGGRGLEGLKAAEGARGEVIEWAKTRTTDRDVWRKRERALGRRHAREARLVIEPNRQVGVRTYLGSATESATDSATLCHLHAKAVHSTHRQVRCVALWRR